VTAVSATDATSTGGRRGLAVTAIAVVVVLVVAIVLLSLIAPARRNDGPPLDPASTGSQGTRAAVELAGRLGADVEVTSELPTADTDVALLLEDLVGEDDTAEVRDWVADGHTLVVADPTSLLTPLADYDDSDPFADSVVVPRDACDVVEPLGVDELRVLESYGPVARFEVPAGATSCFTDEDGDALLVVEPVGDGLLVSVGTPWVFTNEALDQADNAGLFAALAVPEEGARLAVLVAGDDDGALQPQDDGSLSFPTGVSLAILQLFVAFVVYCLYRARRLGKPIDEEPPVVIAGSELTRAVGGLLEHAGARDRAASSLRRAARRRLTTAFGLPAGATTDAVVATVADRTALDRERLDRALVDGPVADDAALATLARELDDLVAAALGGRSGPGAPQAPVAPASFTTPSAPPSSSPAPPSLSPAPPSSSPPTRPGGPS
jgi:hypothetical protein